ncbi:MAG: hypothetical protein KBC38_00950 [Candidatus Pacebacteria bacterium]|nr:hypothetical protein [Candidatus Paceibacterota bacterium]MBP9840206.1 hypothetical protein [Candidatus Paceibacterota bacterium]
MHSVYTGSEAVRNLVPGATITVLDVDGTMINGRNEATESELAARSAVRAYAKETGVTVISTARTTEMVMTAKSFALSSAQGFERGAQKWGLDASGRCMTIPDDDHPFFKHLRDPDIINSFGVGIHVRHECGYREDEVYVPAMREWRLHARSILRAIDAWKYRAPIESTKNYREGVTDVEPLPYRIQLEFKGLHAFSEMRRVRYALLELRDMMRSGIIPKAMVSHDLRLDVLTSMTIVDESHPDKGRYVIYLMPRKARKHQAIEHIIREISSASGVKAHSLRVFVAGDTLTDLESGLYAGDSADSTFMLAGGSRIAPYLTGNRVGEKFADESLTWVHRRLTPTNRPGFYRFKPPCRAPRTVIVGDEAFPGLVGPESVLAGLMAAH